MNVVPAGGTSAGVSAPHVGVSFQAQANRYRMHVEREDVYTIAQCLSGMVTLKAPGKDSDGGHASWVTFELKHRLPVNEIVTVSPEAAKAMTDLFDTVVITVLSSDASAATDDFRICRIQSTRPLTVDTLDEAVFMLSRLSRMCDDHIQRTQSASAIDSDGVLPSTVAQCVDVEHTPLMYTMHLQRRLKVAPSVGANGSTMR